MDNKGFTLVEILISVVILSLIVIFVVNIYSSVMFSTRVEEERLLVMSHNIAVVEQLKDLYYTTGDSSVLMREYEYSDEVFGKGVLYETSITVDRIIFVEDAEEDDWGNENSGDRKYKIPYDSLDLIWSPGSKSELYRVRVDTKLKGRSVPGTEVVTYLSWRGDRDE